MGNGKLMRIKKRTESFAYAICMTSPFGRKHVKKKKSDIFRLQCPTSESDPSEKHSLPFSLNKQKYQQPKYMGKCEVDTGTELHPKIWKK